MWYMFQNKKLCAAMLIPILLLGISNISSAASASEKVLQRKDFATTMSVSAAIYYPKSTQIKYETDYSNAKFVNYVVKNGDMVEAGDPIAVIESKYDAADIRELELKLQRAKEDLSEIEIEKIEKLNEANKLLDKMYSWNSEGLIHLAQLSIDSITEDYDMRILRQKKVIEDIRKNLNKMYDAKNTSEILAPTSGVVNDIQFYKEKDELWDGAYLGRVDDPATILYKVGDQNGIFRYGMDVSLKDKNGNMYKGKVVSYTAPILTNSVTMTNAYVEITDEGIVDYPSKVDVEYTVISYKNAIVLSDREYENDENGYYVLEKTIFGNLKHYFTPSKRINGSVIALDGLDEGMTIVIQ